MVKQMGSGLQNSILPGLPLTVGEILDRQN